MFSASVHSKIAIAVSGGRDSMALLHMACAQLGVANIVALTVDHALRPQSAAEAAMVKQYCAPHNIVHHTLVWHKTAACKTSQAGAREARYALLANWCYQNNIGTLCTGHTQNDVAETFWARLQRGGDLTSLSAMAQKRPLKSFYEWPENTLVPTATTIMLQRPILGLSRHDTTNYCKQHNVPYVDDPSNENTQFERVQHRQFLATNPALENACIASANHLRVAENALQAQALSLFEQHAKIYAKLGCASVPQNIWLAQSAELQYRVLKMLIWQVRGQKCLQILQPLTNQLPHVQTNQTVSVGGCVITPHQGHIFVCRENRFLPQPITLQAGLNIYDNRWLIQCPPAFAGQILGAVGEAAWRRLQVKALPHLPLVAHYTQLAVGVDTLKLLIDLPHIRATLKLSKTITS